MARGKTDVPSNLAAAYVRMSTEHQQYSTSNQLEAIQEYARRRGLEIIRVYSDEGKSGLSIQGRESLAQMLRDVQSGSGGFCCVLVYDVSRWGRFQDTDESAHYEFLCRQAGVQVHYCAEPFENDGSPVSAILKGLKRAMAGEYSRELSKKVFQGACRLARLGYKLGGSSGFGVRRMLIDQSGRHKTVLQPGEQKNIQTDRVIIVPGPEEEIKVVLWIYQMFIDEGKGETEIARVLNAKGVPTENGRPWTQNKVHYVLTAEKYIGNNIYDRRSCKLKSKLVTNPPEEWIRADGAFRAIVEPERFLAAQTIMRWSNRKFSDEELLTNLRALLNQQGRLTSTLIDQAKNLPTANYVAQRFGSLVAAYQALGYKPRLDYSFTKIRNRLFAKCDVFVSFLIERIRNQGEAARWDRRLKILFVNDELKVRVLFMRHNLTSFGTTRWFARLRNELKPDLILAARMDARNEGVRDYYLLPGLDPVWQTTTFAEENGVYLDSYRFPSLEFFLGLIARAKLPETA
jgi:DNA invertase Pin-like site-specific DNA recombinase